MRPRYQTSRQAVQADIDPFDLDDHYHIYWLERRGKHFGHIRAWTAQLQGSFGRLKNPDPTRSNDSPIRATFQTLASSRSDNEAPEFA